MQKLQDSVFTLAKTTNLSPAVFSFLQPTDEFGDKTPLGGILKDTKHGWLALGPKFCVVDLRTGMKVAARTFGATLSNNAVVTSVEELPTPLTENSRQLIISLQSDDISIIVVLNINGSQILRCIQTDVVVTQLAICDEAPDGMFSCFDGIIVAGTKRGEIFGFDLNRAALIQALKDISQGYEHLIQNELKPTNLSFLPLESITRIDEQRELALENDNHLAVLFNENSFIDGQYIYRNPDGSVRMKAKRDHIRVTVLEYIPQTGSVAVGFNFGAFQIWNLMTLDLEFTSQVNVECLPVTHFGFQEPCDDPRAFCYLWVIFSSVDRFEEEEFPLAVMYSLTYQGKRMLSDTKCLYQDFSSATIRFQVDLSTGNKTPLLGGKCISCHTYSIKSGLGDEGEDSMLNLCQLVWESWGVNSSSPMQYGMLLFDLDQWYKDQMPSSYRVESNAFLSASSWSELSGGSGSVALHARLDPASVTPYSHATRLEEHFYPNSLQFNCICLNTSEVCVLSTIGIQRQIISSLEQVGPIVLLSPERLYAACAACGLQPLYATQHSNLSQEEQRRYLLSIALEARLASFLKRCAHDWATGSHGGVGCNLPSLVDWCWKRAIELKENAKELTAPLFVSSALPDRNIVRCLEHCVQQLTQLTGLMDAVLTKCCNLVVPDALSEMEEKHKGIGTVSLYFQVVQWFLRVGLLPERVDGSEAMPYPNVQLYASYNKRRLKLNRIQDNESSHQNSAHKSCGLLYIDQLLEQEFGGQRIHQMWIKGGSDCGGLYPPPSLYALLRLYLLPDIAEEHKHSLVLYLLMDYSIIYDDVRYETVIRRLMQFPTMFGLSNTAIKATQAFWHLDHRDFDFALDQLQCLTGNTLSEWQHNVVLSSLLAQKKTQAALQYLHVRKPAPIQNIKDEDYSRLNDHDKLEDWQSCCNLYLARGLVFEALDVIRMCVQNAACVDEKTQVLNLFFRGCRNTGNLCKVLSITLLPFEEEVFIKYLENCNEPQTSDILIMYYLQQSRYLEADRYNTKLRHTKPKNKDVFNSAESLLDSTDRESTRDNLVESMCAALPRIAERVAKCAIEQNDVEWHVHAPKPMSVFVQAKSTHNKFTYKSTFIQDTIQNASETWMRRPQMRKGIKRLLNIEDTPFICTPKLSRSRSIYTDVQSDATPAKRARHNVTGTPKTPKFKVSEKLSCQMERLLDMPEVQSPVRLYERAETPHSILKSRPHSRLEDCDSPCGSRYLDDTDDELEMDTASNHTHYSDSTNKQLRFTIPTPTDPGTAPTPSPIMTNQMPAFGVKERERSASTDREREMDISTAESYVTTASHAMNESNPLESPPKKLATEANIAIKKTYKDSVRARRSLSISANSSLSDDPNTSMESIADIPITLINPRYSASRRAQSREPETEIQDIGRQRDRRSMSAESTRNPDNEEGREELQDRLEVLRTPTPKGRRGIRASGESTPLRNRSVTPERRDSPIATPLRGRISRSRSKTPEISPRSSPLAVILEQPKQEVESEPHAESSTLSVPRNLRSRSRTPERKDKVLDSPRLEAIKESPTKSDTDSPPGSPSRRNLRNRSRTPEIEVTNDEPVINPNPRNLRSRSKTPELCKKEHVKTKKSLSRLVLEANTFAKTKQTLETLESEAAESSGKNAKAAIECTPMKPLKQPPIMDMTLSPIVNKSILHSSNDSITASSEKQPKDASNTDLNTIPAFTLHETYFEKSVLHSYQSSVGESSKTTSITEEVTRTATNKTLPAFTTIHDDFGQSVLHSYESSVAGTSQSFETPQKAEASKSKAYAPATPKSDFGSVLHSQQSSIANDTTQTVNASSLLTDDNDEIGDNKDNDVDMTETEKAEQKEKAQIGEIERMIDELQDMDNEAMPSGEDESGSEEGSEGSEEGSDSNSSSSSSNSKSDDEAIHVSSDTDSESSESEEAKSPEEIEAEILSIMKSVKSSSRSTSINSMDPIESNTESSDSASKSSSNQSNESSNKSSSNQLNESSNKSSSNQSNKSGVDVCENEFKEDSNKDEPTDPLNQAQISLMTEDGSMNVDEVSEQATNPLDQAQMSLLSDDNSTIVEESNTSEKLETKMSVIVETGSKVSKQDETKDQRVVEIAGTSKQPEKPTELITRELITKELITKDKAVSEDPLAQDSLMTEDTDASVPEISFNYSDDKIDNMEKESEIADIPIKCSVIVQNVVTETTNNTPKSPQSIDVVDTSASEIEMKEATVFEKEPKKDTQISSEVSKIKEAVKETAKVEKEAESLPKESLEAKTEPKQDKESKSQTRTRKRSIRSASTEIEIIGGEPKTPITRKRANSRAKSVDILQESIETDKPMETKEIEEAKTRKRAQSRAKSIDVEIPNETDELKTPATRVIQESIETDKPMETKEIEEPKTRKRAQSRVKSIDIETPKETEEPKTPATRVIQESIETDKPMETKEIEEPKTRKRAQSKVKSIDIETPKETDEPKTPATRKRVTKLTHEPDIDETLKEDEPKTPITRKRAQSTTSNQSEETTPENVTPSRRKTPTSDVRKIITRRMSREMKEDSFDESVSLTPKRRTRKVADDNESIASGSSIASSVQSGDSKRRGRKSVVATKPDLSVIPEVLAEESREQSKLDVIHEYSDARRLTRNQQSMLEKSRGRRLSTPSRASNKSSVSEIEEEERQPAFDLQPIDRISLLNKETYDGPPDADELELSSMSPESIASDASKMRSRMGRSASESKETKAVRAAKINRRIASIDVAESPISSPLLSGTDSPARSRRASFNRAVEALTPKSRRKSIDAAGTSSPVNSPGQSETEVSVTPRRGRRPSTQSNNSQSGRTRTKKMPVLEEDRD